MNGSGSNWYYGQDESYSNRNKGGSGQDDAYRPTNNQSAYNPYSKGEDWREEPFDAEEYGNDRGDPYNKRRPDLDDPYNQGRYGAREGLYEKRQRDDRSSAQGDPRGMLSSKDDEYGRVRHDMKERNSPRNRDQQDAYYRNRRDMYAGPASRPIQPLDVARNRDRDAEPSVFYELDHLATFSVSQKHGLSTPDDGIHRLRHMEKTTGVWAMRVQVRVDRREIVIKELATQSDIESFPISRIQECVPVIAKAGSVEPYNNIVIFVVEGDKISAAEMNLFQCIGCSAEDVVDDINAARAGKFPRPPRVNREPLLLSDSPSPRSQSSRSGTDEPYVRQPSKPKAKTVEDDAIDNDVNLMNRCFDDIERFVASLQEAANVQKEMERLRLKSNAKSSDMSQLKSRPPPKTEYIDTLQKFKVVLNLLPRLKSILKNPDAVELLHSLFGPLTVAVRSSSDDHGIPHLTRSIESPLLTGDTCDMLNNYLNQKEMELWRSLGPAWTTPSYLWRGDIPPQYIPEFGNGWKPSVQQINAACHMLPPASGNRDRSALQQASVGLPPIKPSNGIQSRSQDKAYPIQPVIPDRPAPTRQPPQEQEASSDQLSNQSSPHGIDSGPLMYTVTTSREAKNNKELSVTAGEKVELLDGSKNWWKVRSSTNASGFVPKTFLKPVEN